MWKMRVRGLNSGESLGSQREQGYQGRLKDNPLASKWMLIYRSRRQNVMKK